ncbi:sigma-54-dependent transcriptional regulator [Bradymonas sediminis]|uniref:Sigma-54-dependent Fis family transcriptional regulator n=1 Tax=Bradymonas sediminis TaxID=1548548 RepID=A0A2Z4FRX8_9DELT|nr:sigma-54 dependent transcriptional regulator [Bradymonas sediminis]AWV91456.1 sigma-54-dependent Fis family transcriptional regulator [Bradymonas sediminis]TDP72029.1 two component Fis family sigma54 specific transcriptional regulator [Bradymonas sediminis]
MNEPSSPIENQPPILIIDDEQSMRQFLSIMLKKQDLAHTTAASGEEALSRLDAGERFSVVLTDLQMAEVGGIEVLRAIKETDPACQVVVMTAFASPETAVSAIRAGAYDYITKPFKLEQVQVVVRRALEKFELLRENLYLKESLDRSQGFAEMLGQSKPMQHVFEMIARVADAPATILISGESGTGKELVARAIHQKGARAKQPFLPINCGAIPENLIESELFGHKKGAFTGATQDKKGLFEAAAGGTVFLDEIGELGQPMQVKLLRVLQERKVRPVGAAQELTVDCRILAATNRDLREEVAEGRFREDLYYRLSVIPIEVPPLRERGSDLKLLIEHFVNELAAKRPANFGGVDIMGIDSSTMRILLNYDYPGNVRELQNIIERAVTLTRGDMIFPDVLPPHLQEQSFARAAHDLEIPADGLDLEAMVAQLERELITKALERTDGAKTRAAELLGITFRSLRYRLKKYGMDDSE